MAKTTVPIELSSTPSIVDNGNATAITIDSSENVGIGVTPNSWSSGKKVLQASNASFVGQTDRFEIWSNGYYDGTNSKYIGNNYVTLLQSVNGEFIFNNAPSGTAGNNITFTERVRIDSSGNVGIGTSSPASAISGSATILSIDNTSSDNNLAGVTLKGVSTNDKWEILTGSSNALDFYQATTLRMRINSSGNVGIGTSSPADTYGYGKALDIQSSTGGAVYMRDTADTSKFGFVSFDGTQDRCNVGSGGTGTYLRFITAGDERMRIDSSGLVGINKSSSLAAFLHIDNTGATSQTLVYLKDADAGAGTHSQIQFANYYGVVGQVTTNGTATSYLTSSDYRLKENVTYDWDATTRLKQLKPARFNFISNADTTVDGFLAHEVSSIVPEAIHGEKDEVDDEGNAVYQGIDQSKLVPLLVKTIQELEARITALEGN